jgi:hypothetical protein
MYHGCNVVARKTYNRGRDFLTQMIVGQACGSGQASAQASYGEAAASNLMSMKNVVQNLLQQIDYLSALAEMYSQGGDEASLAAAREATAALERLVRTLNESSHRPCPEWPLAA